MQLIDNKEFLELCQTATLVNGTALRPKMFCTHDDKMIRIFYPCRNKWSRSYWFPKALRFARNSQRLAARGIVAVKVDRVFLEAKRQLHIIFYPKIPGTDLRQLAPSVQQEALQQLPAFLLKLHQNGIFFRAIHLANLLWLPTQTFALVDICDVRFYRRALPYSVRMRNVSHLLSCADDQQVLDAYGKERFIEQYAKLAQLSSSQQQQYCAHVYRRMQKQGR